MTIENLKNMENKKVLIVGFGISGRAAARAMAQLGAKVFVQDSNKEEQFDSNLITFFREKGIIFFLNSIPPDMSVFDMLVISPGVSPELNFVMEAKEKGAEIIGELEIAYRIGSGNYVAITGTNGKTTTTTLVGEIFKKSGRTTSVVGNIGVAVITASVEADEDDWLVTETSSFQLETTKYFKPAVSAILNLTPDHLNRHHTMKAYGEAKAKIFENQTKDGFLIVNYDDKECFKLSSNAKARVIPFSRKKELELGAFVLENKIVIRNLEDDIVEICNIGDLRIIGEHNVENALAAAAICYFSGIPEDIIAETLKEFNGVEHRLEFCNEIEGVKYYNDSKGTNTDAAITALKAIKENIILIAGGDSKGQEFDDFIKAFKGSVKKMILLGRDAHYIQEAADRNGFNDYVYGKDMDACVKLAYGFAEQGDSVLLSPACASWDMYDNFEQRGKHFKDCVERLEA